MDPTPTSQNDRPSLTRLADYKIPDFLVDHVELDVDLAPRDTVVAAKLHLRRNKDAANGQAPLVLDGEDLELLDIQLDGVRLASSQYIRTETDLTIPDMPDKAVLETRCRIAPADNTKLEGLYQSGGIYCTQCEAEGFRRITYYPDRPDVMALSTTTLRADAASAPILLSNGNLIEQRQDPDGRLVAVWHDPHPKPSYLFALVGGKLDLYADRFTTMDGRDVRLAIYVDPGNRDKCQYAMQALKHSMAWDEKVYGLAYDLDLFNIVAIHDFNMGAMENKSLNIFNAKFILADPETATDDDYAHIESVVAHEYFHNWTGNRVTCRDWFQLSLKEGLTVFRDQEFSADMRSRAVKRIQDVRTLRAAQFPEDAGPLAHPIRPEQYIEINNFYTATVYEKGAEVIRMIHRLLGAENFRKGMDLYFARHDGQAVTCEDFVAAMADASGIDLGQFQNWYRTAGTPKVTVQPTYNAATKRLTLQLTQNTPPTPGQEEKPDLVIPLAIGMLDGDGNIISPGIEADSVTGEEIRPDNVVGGVVVNFHKKSQTVTFDNIPGPPILSVNRGFSAPVIMDEPHDLETRAVLMRHDPDLFQRWEAGQQAALSCLLDALAARQNDRQYTWPTAYVDAMGALLADDAIDPALLAEAMLVPGLAYLFEQQTVVDVDGSYQVRLDLRRHLADALAPQFQRLHDKYRLNSPYSPDAGAAAGRAVRNAALAYLALRDDPDTRDALVAQYHDADNMTDRWAALEIISHRPETDAGFYDAALRADLQNDFYNRYRDESLVVDKWFRLQASAPLPGIVGHIETLEQHDAFSIKAPNKVRALYGAFASGNPTNFHHTDGSGYRFVAERVKKLNDLNPQIASRLAQIFARWQRYDPDRQKLMQAALQDIGSQPNLSPDLYEIVNKSLVGS